MPGRRKRAKERTQPRVKLVEQLERGLRYHRKRMDLTVAELNARAGLAADVHPTNGFLVRVMLRQLQKYADALNLGHDPRLLFSATDPEESK